MDRLESPSHKVLYVLAASLTGYDCVSVGGCNAHMVRVEGAGTLTVTDASGVASSFPVYDREPVIMEIASIGSFTGTGLRIHWPKPSAS